MWGALVAWRVTEEPLSEDTERRLGAFASLAGTAIANADARTALAASRKRIVTAADQARRRLERNLHDGAQQRFVSLSLALRLTLSLLESDPAGAAEHLRGAQHELAQGLEELRELARGIHPAILTERGLRAAVDSLVLRAQVPVDVIDMPEGRLPPEVEAAAYYVVSEALANVTRYAGADRATVAVALADGTVIVEVADDGSGGADPSRGSGLRGLADRVEAIGGRLEIASPLGAGTTVRAILPCDTASEFVETTDPPGGSPDRRFRTLPDGTAGAAADHAGSRSGGPSWPRVHPMRLATSRFATIAFTICFTSWGLVAPLAKHLQETNGWSDTQVLLLAAVPVLCGSILRIPAGWLADRYGGRKIFTLIMLASIVPAVLLGYTSGYGALLVVGFFMGAAGSAFAVGVPFVVGWYDRSRQGFAVGVYAIGTIGPAIALLVVPRTLENYGQAYLGWGMAAALVAGAVMMWFLGADAPNPPKPTRYREVLARAGGSTGCRCSTSSPSAASSRCSPSSRSCSPSGSSSRTSTPGRARPALPRWPWPPARSAAGSPTATAARWS